MKPALPGCLAPICIAIACFGISPALAGDAGTTAIETLGWVHGLAAACKQPVYANRARNALVGVASKVPTSEALFAKASETAERTQGPDRPCPDSATFVRLLDAAEKGLQSAYTPGR